MPDNEVETIEEEEEETKEDIEVNTPPLETKPKPIDYSKHRRQFPHVPIEKIRKTFTAMTQNAASIACASEKPINPKLPHRGRLAL